MRITIDPAPDYMPVWTSDGTRLIFTSERSGGAPNLYMMSPDGNDEAQQLFIANMPPWAGSVSADDKQLAFTSSSEGGDSNVWITNLEGNGQSRSPFPLIQTPYSECRPEFSPDGKCLAFSSNLSGKWQVYVISMAERGMPIPVSEPTDYNNVYARWSRSTNELFYRDGDRMMAVSYKIEGTKFLFDKPTLLFESKFARRGWPDWDVAPDGKRFFVFLQTEEKKENVAASKSTFDPENPEAILILNWFEELKRLVPTGK